MSRVCVCVFHLVIVGCLRLSLLSRWVGLCVVQRAATRNEDLLLMNPTATMDFISLSTRRISHTFLFCCSVNSFLDARHNHIRSCSDPALYPMLILILMPPLLLTRSAHMYYPRRHVPTRPLHSSAKYDTAFSFSRTKNSFNFHKTSCFPFPKLSRF